MSAMPPVAPTAVSRSMVDRVKAILMQPRAEFAVIDAEPATVASIYRYVLILAAVGPLCHAIGMSVFGISIPFIGGTIRMGAGYAVRSAVVQYVVTLIGVYLVALIVDALAPSFGGQKNQIQALKVTAYSWTAAFVGGVFGLFPPLAIVGLLFALYSLYLLYLGLPVLMKAPAEKALGYTIVSIVAAIVVFIVISVVTTRLAPMPGFDAGSITS